MSDETIGTRRYFPKDGLFPVEFSGADSNGHHAAYFVKPEDADSSKYRLHLGIRNVWRDKLVIPSLVPSPSDYHLRLRFRPGLIDGRVVRQALPLANELEQQLGVGWKWHDLHTDSETGEVGVCFSYASSDKALEERSPFEWKHGQTLTIQLRPFQNAPQSGGFFLKTELDYGNLPGLRDDEYQIKVRELNLAVVDLSGSTFFPGKAAVLGSNTIVNNGQPNSRAIKLWNSVHHSVIPFSSTGVDHESGSTITLAIRCHGSEDNDIENHPSVLGTMNELSEMSVRAEGAPSTGGQPIHWEARPHEDVPGWLSWEITPNPESGVTRHEIGRADDGSAGASVIEALEFRLDNLKSTAPDGVANVYLHFHHLPGLADHTLIVPLEKTPIVVRGRNVGIGTVPQEGTAGALHVSGTGQFESVVATDSGDRSIKSSGRIQDKTGELMPVGAIIAYASSHPPDGWLLCDGREIKSLQYADLYARLPSANSWLANPPKYLPDLRSRFIVGAGQGRGLSRYNQGGEGGEETVTLNTNQMPQHTHAGNTTSAGAHEHKVTTTKRMEDDYDYSDRFDYLNVETWDKSGTAGEHTHSLVTFTAGGGTPHNNLPPYYALTYIIKY